MRAAFATLAFIGFAIANPAPQAVTSAIAPSQSPPAGCYEDYDGSFLIGPVNVSSSTKRDVGAFEIIPLDKRNTKLGITLQGGILTDPQGRTGYIASNQQFQFDGPPQAGAIWTAGFSVCENNRLVLGNDETWWKCLSGNFYNLYFKSIGGQCIESYLITRPEPGSGGPIVSAQSNAASSTATTPPASPQVSSSASGSAAGNATAPASGSASSSSASGSMSMSGSASSSGATGVGGTTTRGGGTNTMTGGGATNTAGGSPTGAAASSSVAPGAAPMATLKAEMLGLAAGVFALAAL